MRWIENIEFAIIIDEEMKLFFVLIMKNIILKVWSILYVDEGIEIYMTIRYDDLISMIIRNVGMNQLYQK